MNKSSSQQQYQIIFLIFLIGLFDVISGLLPSVCISNVTEGGSQICCPNYKNDSSLPCGFPLRGECRPIVAIRHGPIPLSPYNMDIRQLWPSKLVKYACHCFGKYFGEDCNDCWPGWTGKYCNRRSPILIRRNVLSYTSEEKHLFIQVLLQLHKRQSNYLVPVENKLKPYNKWIPATMHEVLIFIHYFTSRKPLKLTLDKCYKQVTWKHLFDYNHEGPAFLTWHRYFMLLWERWSQQIAKEEFHVDNFTFPYWDWTDRRKCEVCTDDLMGDEDVSSPTPNGFRLSSNSSFRNWTVYCFKVIGDPCAPCFDGPQNEPLTRSWKDMWFPSSDEITQAIASRTFDIYELIDKEKFFNPSLTPLTATTPTMRCSMFALQLEGVCPVMKLTNNNNNNDHGKYLYLHNRLHNMCNGTFHDTRTSPNDPFFILHHIQVDRIFQAWLRTSGAGPEQMPTEELHVGHCKDCPIVGFFPQVFHKQLFVDSINLGYDYDNYQFKSPQEK